MAAKTHQGESVVMLGYEDEIFRARVHEQVDPVVRVPRGCGEVGDEVVVHDVWSVRAQVMHPCRRARVGC